MLFFTEKIVTVLPGCFTKCLADIFVLGQQPAFLEKIAFLPHDIPRFPVYDDLIVASDIIRYDRQRHHTGVDHRYGEALFLAGVDEKVKFLIEAGHIRLKAVKNDVIGHLSGNRQAFYPAQRLPVSYDMDLKAGKTAV